MYVQHALFFWLAVLRPPSAFLALSAVGQARPHRYITTHVSIPAELSGGAQTIQRRCAGFSFQGVAFRLAAQAEQVHGKPRKYHSIARSTFYFRSRSAPPSAVQRYQSNLFTLSAVC